MASTDAAPEIPKTCKAGVVENEGPDFKLVVEDVPVPEPGMTIQHDAFSAQYRYADKVF
jgi:hypothetical protein